jgi:hypothetical protein
MIILVLESSVHMPALSHIGEVMLTYSIMEEPNIKSFCISKSRNDDPKKTLNVFTFYAASP